MKSILRLVIPAVLLAVLIIGFSSIPQNPMYGPYTAADLISSTNYENVRVPSIASNKLEVARMVHQLGLARTLQKAADDPAYAVADGQCHGAVHVIGRVAFDLLGPEALRQCTTVCFSGCYHGVFQEIAATEGNGELLNRVQELCNPEPTVFGRDECFHGSGHGFLMYAGYDLKKAIGECKALGTRVNAISCYGGVFMEYTMGEASSEADLNVDRMSATDPHFPCSLYADDSDAEMSCYKLQPSHFLNIYGDDFSKASAECMHASESMRGTCFMRLGQLKAADTKTPSQNNESFCDTVPSAYFASCIIGGVREIINYHGIDPTGPPALFCKGMLEAQAKSVCYREYAARLPDMFLDKDTRLSICALFEAPFAESCRAAQE